MTITTSSDSGRRRWRRGQRPVEITSGVAFPVVVESDEELPSDLEFGLFFGQTQCVRVGEFLVSDTALSCKLWVGPRDGNTLVAGVTHTAIATAPKMSATTAGRRHHLDGDRIVTGFLHDRRRREPLPVRSLQCRYRTVVT